MYPSLTKLSDVSFLIFQLCSHIQPKGLTQSLHVLLIQ